jgi:DNA-binding LytR/AlgR family response regulator
LELNEIYFVEGQSRMLYYHTADGDYVVKGTMQSAENSLAEFPFAKCNHWYLVNLMYVTEVRKNTAVVGPYELEISRRNRAGFLKALTEFMGGNS